MLVQTYTELASEVIERHVPALERLQHQDLLNRGLSLARRSTDHQQASQQRSLQSAIHTAMRTRRDCLARCVLRVGQSPVRPAIAESIIWLEDVIALVDLGKQPQAVLFGGRGRRGGSEQ